MAVKLTSISARLLVASALLLPLFLGLTGFFLDNAFQRSLMAAEDARLRTHLYLLFSVAELPNIRTRKVNLEMPTVLMEPDFERLNSGLYAYIYNEEKELIWRSNSAALMDAPTNDRFAEQSTVGQLIVQEETHDESLRFSAHYDVIWEDARGKGHPFRFAVTHDGDAFLAELKAYRNQLWRWLGAAGLLLLLAQTVILRWGLRPLSKLARALKAMQSGDTRNIAGEHPRELQRIVDNLNLVLAREEALRQRYRNSLSDLAHSLKTPLAVLQGKVNQGSSDGDLQQTLAEQVTRMNQVVTYQLQRAVSSQQQGLNQRIDVEQVVQRLVAALQKVYRDKQVDCQTSVNNSLFVGDEQDLLELLGNLLENAFKYCHRQVRLEARTEQQQLVISISDDGAGIPIDQQERILQRGQRLDTTQPGQGIGLAVSADIIASYGGQLHIDRSSLGGAAFILTLPIAS
ncbi:ATP-binding protein [Cellvibrio sp. PSBB006]|uniref:ATP-binding protein n=1 Tax=Cellvibrio sp. PSBB006 TaxID=1987723 RepID=UPI000B3BA84A|nr:ATP-binding protein [Cellvibrio sp. PSBB006]ARU29350.1 sensor histidine kinase [Cellvibrio sp. PSBB006]